MDHYSCVKKIGSGSYGDVLLVRHKKDKKQYVLKCINLQNASKRELRAANLEVQLLSSLKHPNIVSYRESFESTDGLLYIVMGYCEGGDLYSRIKGRKGVPFAEQQVVEWFIQICMALQYLHDRKILHRDLKTQNVFLTRNRIIKVGDLGIAKVLDGDNVMATTLIGTPYYMSPELLTNRPYSYKSDVWALGCCMYEVATLRHAFTARDMNSLMIKILRGKLPEMPKTYSTELHDLILSLLKRNPAERPSVARILRHPYIKKNIDLFLEGIQSSVMCSKELPLESLQRASESPKIKSEVTKWRRVDLLLQGVRGIQVSLERVKADASNQKRKMGLPLGREISEKCTGLFKGPRTNGKISSNAGGELQSSPNDELCKANLDQQPPTLIDGDHEGQKLKLTQRCRTELRRAADGSPLLEPSKLPPHFKDGERFVEVSFEARECPSPNHIAKKDSDKNSDVMPVCRRALESEKAPDVNQDGQRTGRNSLARQRRRQKLLHLREDPLPWPLAEVSI